MKACVLWTGSFPEMALMEVTLPGGFGADAQLLYSQLGKTSSLLRRIELTPSNSRATFYLGTRDGSDTSDHVGHQCYKIHATGPRVKTRPAYARVQDYYVPAINDTQVYTIPEECPPRIVHEADDYRTSDNLYSKARATDSDDIVITHEFSFDDIPEGIPLEDPLLYDHLTENENYRTPENQQEVAKLELNNMNAQNDGPSQKVANIHTPPENMKALQPTEQVYSNFDNVVNGYFCENDATTISNINDIINKGTGKANNFANAATSVVKPGHHQSVSPPVSAQYTSNDRNFDKVINENLRTDDSLPNNEKTDNMESFLEKIDDITRLSEEIDTIHRQFHSGETHDHYANIVRGNTDVTKTTVTAMHHTLSTSPDHKISESATNDTTSRNIELVTGLNETLNYQSNLDKKLIESLASNKPMNKDSHTSNENLMTLENSEGDQQNSDAIDSENITTELKNKATKDKNDETQLDTKNNLVHEIDNLNKIAHRQLDETRAKFDVHQIDYTQMYALNADVDFISNKNYNNAVDNYFEQANRDNEIKRSFKEHTPDVQVSQQMVSNSNEYKNENDKIINNPSFTDFHVIDTDKDLEVPPGIEGPVPVSVLPPPGFVAPAGDSRRMNYQRIPFEDPNRAEVSLPRNFGRQQSQIIDPKLSLDMDLPFGHDTSGVFESFPAFHQPLTFPGYRRMLSLYPGYSQYPKERVLRSSRIMGSTKRKIRERDLTSNGPYFYVKPDAIEKFFIPMR
ncbi:hypothetical protein HF086_017427 [Spodoptera exigua]|uniref:Alpha-macroglobulin receptor-binding domain-containing protein n=1 Tax=Spodoptera exigua TaxID=7107 RepID=A0A922MFW2_SPOEX|nr:hypothetical protein HF086_017427 [Spodoptera exigua]